jgi:hypothetical protein
MIVLRLYFRLFYTINLFKSTCELGPTSGLPLTVEYRIVGKRQRCGYGAG